MLTHMHLVCYVQHLISSQAVHVNKMLNTYLHDVKSANSASLNVTVNLRVHISPHLNTHLNSVFYFIKLNSVAFRLFYTRLWLNLYFAFNARDAKH
jgi:hypothetical protein